MVSRRSSSEQEHLAPTASIRARRRRLTAQAVWLVVAVLLVMEPRLQSDVDMQEEQELRALERGERAHVNMQGEALQIVAVEPTPSAMMASVPIIDVPLVPLGVASAGPQVAEPRGASIGGAGGPARLRKSKRMDRRLSHWQCIFCRHEMPNDANATRCGRCDQPKAQLRDADANGREAARRQAREKEHRGRMLNARGAGTVQVPRAAQGVFERERADALVRWEVKELEQYTGSPGYLEKEEYMLGVMESFYIVQTAGTGTGTGTGRVRSPRLRTDRRPCAPRTRLTRLRRMSTLSIESMRDHGAETGE